jgi:hypothetical protein
MAEWIDEEVETAQVGEGETLVESDQVTESLQTKEPEPVEAEQTQQEDDIPARYQGKSIQDVIHMHREAEKALGRQGNEIGEMRKMFDEFVQTSAQDRSKPEPSSGEDVDYFVDPQNAVNRQIDSHPALQEMRGVANEMRKAQGQAALRSKHGDFESILRDPEFTEWVESSPVRQRLLVEADKRYDVAAADELFSTFKQLKGMRGATAQADRKSAVKSASNGGSRTNPDGQRRGRIYRRADIRKLMMEDPKRYEELQPEIMAAYAENRVRG